MPEGLTIESLPLRARCPRCGYDQRGTMARWQDACPLESTCTECGLLFEWAEVLNPERSMPSWCVEARRGLWRWPWQFVRTSARAWWPSRLWQPLKMSHPQRGARQLAIAVAWLGLLVLMLALCNGLAAARHWQSVMRTARGWTPSTGPWPCFVEAALMPWASESRGYFAPPGVRWLTTPSGAPLAVTQNPYTPPRTFLELLLRPIWPFLVIVLALPLTCGIAFAALPITRKRAKVRWQHLRRATAYAFAISSPLAACIVLTRFAHTTPSPSSAQTTIAIVLTMALIALASAFPVVFIVYWWQCVRHHLRLQHPGAAVISVQLIGLLASVALAYWCWEWARQA